MTEHKRPIMTRDELARHRIGQHGRDYEVSIRCEFDDADDAADALRMMRAWLLDDGAAHGTYRVQEVGSRLVEYINADTVPWERTP